MDYSPQFDFLVGHEESSFWESGDCFNDKIIPCVEEESQPLVLAAW